MSNEVEEMLEHPQLSSNQSDDNLYSAEFKDGQLHIVEVSPYDKVSDNQDQSSYQTSGLLPELRTEDDGEETKYLQLDLLNFTIVKNNDGTNTYQMVSDSGAADGDTITCVLSSEDVDDAGEGSYMMLQTDDDQESYMYLQSVQNPEVSTQEPITAEEHIPETKQPEPPKPKEISKSLTPIQILEKAKALQKARALMKSFPTSKSKRGRKRKSDLPPPLELLSSPNFKLYLYSCKLCMFKCNAIKEMSAHKKAEHAGGAGGGARGEAGGAGGCTARAPLQCARCPYRGHTHSQLMNHVTRAHAEKEAVETSSEYITALQLDSEEVEAADVLVCGACGFESGDRTIFKKHIVDVHGAITSLD